MASYAIHPNEVSSLVEQTQKAERQHAERQAAELKEAANSVQTKAGSVGQAVFTDGNTTYSGGHASTSVTVSEGVPQGHVRLANGMTTTIEAAEVAGLLDTAVEFNRADRPSFNSGSLQSAQSGTQEANSGQPSTQLDDTAALDLPGATEEDQAQFVKANEALDQASSAIGSFAVSSIQQNVVASGVLPTELPKGVSQEMLDAIVDGYVTQADVVLRDTGVTVEAMCSFLNETELRDARIAVVKNDDARLKELAGHVKDRLRGLPDDPVLFKEWTGDWPSSAKVTRVNGDTMVDFGGGPMRWVTAVETGQIKFR